MARLLNSSRSATFGRVAALVVCAGLAASACSSDKKAGTATTQDPVAAAQARVSDAQSALTKAQAGLTAAREDFCLESKAYIKAIDRYGKVFTTAAATVGDVQTAGADLKAPKQSTTDAASAVTTAQDAVVSAEKELAAAQAALATASSSSTSVAPTTTTTTIVPEASVTRVKQAEADLTSTALGITAQTPLTEATAEYNAAAYSLEVAWMQLFADAGCLTDDQQAELVAKVRDYTIALQTDLHTAGYYTGAIDGIYGPTTVEAVKKLQTENGLPVTGFVDQATAAALATKVGTQSLTQTAALQSVLKVAGYWTGPVDGTWTPELTDALKTFQTELGVPPTGAVDAATLSALETAVTKATTPTTAAPTTAPAATTAPPPTTG